MYLIYFSYRLCTRSIDSFFTSNDTLVQLPRLIQSISSRDPSALRDRTQIVKALGDVRDASHNSTLDEIMKLPLPTPNSIVQPDSKLHTPIHPNNYYNLRERKKKDPPLPRTPKPKRQLQCEDPADRDNMTKTALLVSSLVLRLSVVKTWSGAVRYGWPGRC